MVFVNRMCVAGDTNPAPLLKPDGSVEMMWRTTEMDPQPTACPADSCMALATASSWRGPYQWSRANIFANQSAATHTHIEDAHMWLAPKGSTNPGSYHAIFHSDVRCSAHVSCCCPPQGNVSVQLIASTLCRWRRTAEELRVVMPGAQMACAGRFRRGMRSTTPCS